MKIKLLASCIASAWLVTGCGGGSGSGSDPITSSASESVAETASVNISAAFPETAQAAAIDGNTQSITVAFYPSEAGSIEEAMEVVELSVQCFQDSEIFGDTSCLPEDGPAIGEPAILTAGTPTVSLELIPGKYRVEAYQFDTPTPDVETIPISATSSFVTLSSGAHSVELNLVHATWTATTSITPQLLGNVVQDENSQDIDLDPGVEGTQTIADLLDMTSQPVIGMHLVGMPTFMEETAAFFDSGSSSATSAFEDFTIDSDADHEDIAHQIIDFWLGESNHIPVLRQSDGGTGETVVWWWDDPTIDGCNVYSEFDDLTGSEICVERFSSPATLLQEYQPTLGNSNILNLGELVAEYEEWSFDGPGLNVEGGLVTVPFLFEDPTVTTDGTTVTITWNDDFHADVHTETIETLNGFEDMTFLDFSTGTGTTTFADDANRLDQVDAPNITGGTTITGTIVEFLVQFTEDSVAATVPTVPDTITPTSTVASIAGTQAAVAAGLIAEPAATANGENCSALTDNFSGVFTKFIWNDADGTWEGGTWNHTYFLFDSNNDGTNDTVEGEDLNGDGSVDQFEVGIYENWACTWDDINQMEVCDDLDGVANDTTDKYETVPTGFEETGSGEYCLHEFTMTADQLSFSFSDLLSSTDVTVQN